AAVVLDGAGEDLRGRGRAPVDQHRQRTVPGHPGVLVTLHADAATRLADLHHRAVVDEQAGELDRLVQRAAPVVAQVQHHPVDALPVEFAQQAGDVAGRRGVVVAAHPATLEVLVEARQLDDADPAIGHAVAAFDVVDLGLGGLVLDPDLVAGDRHPHRLAVQPGLGGHYVQPHQRALGTADLLDHVVQAPADHVLDLAVAALANADDAVAGPEQAGLVGRSTGHDL